MEEKERIEGQISKHSRICSSDMRLINYPKSQEQKVYIWDKELCNGTEWNDFLKCVEEKGQENEELKKENQQLKQQLHDLPKKIVEEVEKNFTEYLPLKDKTGAGFYSRLNAILKKYGGENE